jgi:hypothetical protein
MYGLIFSLITVSTIRFILCCEEVGRVDIIAIQLVARKFQKLNEHNYSISLLTVVSVI